MIPASDNIRFFYLSCLSWMLFGLFVSFNSVAAQETTLSRQIIPHEITSRGIRVIHEDQFGLIWYGSTNLYKYDGKRSKKYTAVLDDSISVGFGWVFDILEEPNGDLLLATSKGPFRYKRATDQIQPLFRKQFINQFGTVDPLLSLFKDSRSRLWLGGKTGLYLIDDLEGDRVKKVVDFPTGSKLWSGGRAFWESEGGTYYVATSHG